MEFICKIFKDKKKSSLIYIVLIIGIIVLSIPEIFKPTPKATPSDSPPPETKSDDLRIQLEDILGKIQGVEQVSVMVSYESSGEIVPAMQSSGSETKPVILNDSGGKQQALILRELKPKVKGVIVAAKGAGNAKTKEDIFTAISAVVDVEPHNIAVFELKKQGGTKK